MQAASYDTEYVCTQELRHNGSKVSETGLDHSQLRTFQIVVGLSSQPAWARLLMLFYYELSY